MVDTSLAQVNKALAKNDDHVENLRQLNKNILKEFQNLVEDQFGRQGQINDELKEEIRKAVKQVMADVERKFQGIEGLSKQDVDALRVIICLLYTSPSPRD